MANRNNLISNLLITVLFLFLEAVSIWFVYRTGIIQEYKIAKGIREINSFFWEKGSRIENYFSLEKENLRLADANSKLLDIADKYYSLLEERAIDSLKYTAVADFDYIPASIIKNSTNNQHNYFVLNRGIDDGITEDMGVVTDRGIGGIVISVSKNYSLVLSFMNENQSFSALIKRNNTFGPISWSGESPKRAIMREIPLHATIIQGDTIVTSGYSAILPPGIPIGKVLFSSVVNGVNQSAVIELFEDYRALRHVYIVRNRNGKEIEELFNNRD